MLASASLKVDLRARLLIIVAAIQVDRGRLEPALATGRKALDAADRSGDSALAALAAALFLERNCDHTQFDASLPMAAQVRRRAIRCTDVQARAMVHLTFGRLEGRGGHLRMALRHFSVGRHLIALEPNDMVSSALDLDESSVLFLLGDLTGALEMAQRAAHAASVSGWAKGRTVALLNVSQFLVSLGRLEEADAQIALAKNQPF
jgi:hypothetical protein